MKLPIRNAYLCLRPEIFGIKDEHVTLEYLGHEPEYESVAISGGHWLNRFEGLPIRVRVNGYANWSAKEFYHSVALVEFVDYPELSYSKNWHITLESSRQPVESPTFDRLSDAFRYDDVDSLWLGYKDAEGNKKFIEAYKAIELGEKANVG